MKLIKGENDLRTLHPELAKEWHPVKNGDLKPDDVTCGSSRTVWWQCNLEHEWQQRISHRVEGNSCPYCSGRRLLKGFNDLLTKFPELATEWHPSKNGNLTPMDFVSGSNSKAWWLGKCGHEWETRISNRTMLNSGCPYCSGRMVIKGFNDLRTKDPALADEWHPTKNIGLKNKSGIDVSTPDKITASSDIKVWWQCKEGHEWQTSPNIRSGTKWKRCPYCYRKTIKPKIEKPVKVFISLQTKNPEIASEWNFEKNGDLKPSNVSSGSNKKIWWKCKKGHEWEQRISDRVRNNRKCPICSNSKVLKGYNDLATTNPSLASEWNYEKNGDLRPDKITALYAKKVWWKGKCGHEWDCSVYSRNQRGSGCPYCSGKRVLPGFNDLQTLFPELASEWHPTKNGDITPDNIYAFSGKKVWWRCKKGHDFSTTIRYRSEYSNEQNCPVCIHKRILSGYNDLATTNPELAKEWHPTKNKGRVDRNGNDISTPDKVFAGTKKKVWWLCKCGYEWETDVKSRNRGQGCPVCGRATSFPERAFYYYIKKHYPDAIRSDREMIGYELDIYIPSIKTAIEYDGEHWHSDSFTIDKDIMKNKLCKDAGITLIRVREPKLKSLSNCICFFRENLNRDGLEDAIKTVLKYLNCDDNDIDTVRDTPSIQANYMLNIDTKILKKEAS